MERAAAEALQKYAPNFLDRLLGRDRTRKEELERGVGIARLSDDRIFSDAQQEYRTLYQDWLEWHSLSQRAANKDTASYPAILELFGIFTTFIELGIKVRITGIDADMMILSATGPLGAIVPETELTLTPAGKISPKVLGKTKYWSLFKDHICSCALRITGDVFNVLPIDRLILNLGETRISPATGHPEPITLLGIDVSRAALNRINLVAVSPSDAMINFNVKWKFHKANGFAPVTPVTPQDNWLSSL